MPLKEMKDIRTTAYYIACYTSVDGGNYFDQS